MKFALCIGILLIKCIICNKEKMCKQSEFLNSNSHIKVLSNYVPAGYASKAITFLYSYKYTKMVKCIKDCCSYRGCDSVIFNNSFCSLVHCKQISDCEPVKLDQMFHNQYYFFFKNIERVNKPVLKYDEDDHDDYDDDNEEDLDDSDGNGEEGISTCELSVPENCGKNQYCKRVQEKSKAGICVCLKGYIKKDHHCLAHFKLKPTYVINNQSALFNFSNPLSSSNKTKILDPKVYLRNQTIGHSKDEIQSEHKPTNITSISSESFTLKADAGPDLNVKVHKSSLFDHPEIVSVYGCAKIKNKILDSANISYFWKRLPDSLAAGTIVNHSNYKPTLLLTNLLQGQYLFELTVHSMNGNSSKDDVKINVTETEDEKVLNFANIILTTNVYEFSEKEKNNFANRMAHIIEKDLSYSQCVVYIHSIAPHFNNKTRITFYAKMFDSEKKFRIIPSGLLERKLKDKIVQHKYIFDFPVEKFESHFCYNDCSGHGTCDQVSRRCQCHMPWFNNRYREYKTGYSNCDMHVMLVVLSCVAGLFSLVLIFAILKRLIRVIKKRSSYGKKILQYRLLQDEADS